MTNLEIENKRLLDIVNENDEIVGSESRTQAHKLGLLHREVHVWMFDKDKNIFFQKRGLHRPSAGALDATVGGHVNKGENYLEAAIREAKEEAGISIKPKDLTFINKFKKVTNHNENGLGETINNFIRSVYVYNDPISEKALKKETGIPRGGFQKLSLDFLLQLNSLNEKDLQMFDKSILTEELFSVLSHLK